MVEDILVKVDRASMLASLEVRAPFLDHRVIDFAFGEVPDSLKATARERKILLRQLGRQLLPTTHDLVRKQGFSLPLAALLRGEWRTNVRAILESLPEELFDRRWVRRLLGAHDSGYPNEHRIFALAFFELWRRTYNVSCGIESRFVGTA
jgi:asparagine synthase (glutamine-hydrolysing)